MLRTVLRGVCVAIELVVQQIAAPRNVEKNFNANLRIVACDQRSIQLLMRAGIMADKVEAVGSGPVSICSGGKQELVPLNEIYFEDGVVKTSHRGADASFDDVLQKWLALLVSRGEIKKGKVVTQPRLFTAKAAVPGANGNAIRLSFRGTVNPAEVVITVDATETYDDLTLDTIETVLGKAGGPPGQRPGLLRVDSVTARAPVAGPAVAQGDDPETWKVAGAAGDSFTLVEWQAGNAGTTNVAVSNVRVVSGKTHFQLDVTWHHEVTVTTAALANLAELGFAVTFDPPNGWTKLPELTPAQLVGGGEPVSATAAAIDVLARR